VVAVTSRFQEMLLIMMDAQGKRVRRWV